MIIVELIVMLARFSPMILLHICWWWDMSRVLAYRATVSGSIPGATQKFLQQRTFHVFQLSAIGMLIFADLHANAC